MMGGFVSMSQADGSSSDDRSCVALSASSHPMIDSRSGFPFCPDDTFRFEIIGQ
jgi:hypothetical protein